jgi:hypothetical protein
MTAQLLRTDVHAAVIAALCTVRDPELDESIVDLGAKAFGLLAASLVLTGAVVVWMFRRAWTDHDVSDPGVTL